MSSLVVCSHRGPLSFRRTGRKLTARRGGGGLIGAVHPVMQRFGGTWVAAAMSPGDHHYAAAHPDGGDQDGFSLRLAALPEQMHDLHYDVVSNEVLWFLFHYLFETPLQPVLDGSFHRAWEAYLEVNRAFAAAAAESVSAETDAVLIEDYHLLAVGKELRRRRVRPPTLYFHHTPWCEPDYFSMLGEEFGKAVLELLLAYDSVAFHARRWADAFLRCCERFVPAASVFEDGVKLRGRTTTVRIAPVPVDVPLLRKEADQAEVDEWVDKVDSIASGRRLIVRVDRMDLSKNALRGFLAFESLLEREPERAGDTVFLALQNPSRTKVSAYRRYFAECLRVVKRTNDRFGDRAPGDEGPVQLHFGDNFHRSLAALRRSDVLLVNPVFDGLNMVAKEGAVLNERDGALVLSVNAGAAEELDAGALMVNPFDVVQTAESIETGLAFDARSRARRARLLRRAVEASTPDGWARARLSGAGVSI